MHRKIHACTPSVQCHLKYDMYIALKNDAGKWIHVNVVNFNIFTFVEAISFRSV